MNLVKMQDLVIKLHFMAKNMPNERIAQHLRESADRLSSLIREYRYRDLAERQMRFPHKEEQVGPTPTVTTINRAIAH